MKGKIITIFVLMLVNIPILVVTANIYTPISTPMIIGETDGIIGKTYEYIISSTHHDGDDVYYDISWGDCLAIKNDGPYKSGEEVIFSHSWCEVCCRPGDFTIYVKATDGKGTQSNQAMLIVTMNSGEEIIKTQFLNFLEKHPSLFPLLRQLLRL
jgi:hypothetical protein